MGVSSFVLKILAKQAYKKNLLGKKSAISNQQKVLKNILSFGEKSMFGKHHNINSSLGYEEFKKSVPISNYEDYKKYISIISHGGKNILTKGQPKYFAITSGTTSGTKYIPLTKKMLYFNTKAMAELLLLYAYQKNDYNISNVGMMFIQGSPKLNYLNHIPFAKLSGIVALHVPFFLKKYRYPSMATNCIDPWGNKIEAIVKETWDKDMKIIGGIPPWVITYFEALLKYTNKQIVCDVFSNLKLYIHGGTGFGPYKKAFLNLCGSIDTLEVYPASEGFFAYQDNLLDKSLLLLTNHGVFYEFIALNDFKKNKMSRIPLDNIVLNVDYVMLISTVAGLWGYNTGDTIRFVSKNPYKIIFSGRANQYCSTFGEHVIEKEVEKALVDTLKKVGGVVLEFTVCPKINKKPKLSHHEWFIEFLEKPTNLKSFEEMLDRVVASQNIYYRDLIQSKIIAPLQITLVKRGGFDRYMKSIGKFGGQNKCPHLSNKRIIGDFLLKNNVEN